MAGKDRIRTIDMAVVGIRLRTQAIIDDSLFGFIVECRRLQ